MSNSDLPRLTLEEFIDEGYLLEVNRAVLHPLGLAIYVDVDEETGEVTWGGIMDNRDDPEGWIVGVNLGDEKYDADIKAKIENIMAERQKRWDDRVNSMGYWVQPAWELGGLPSTGDPS